MLFSPRRAFTLRRLGFAAILALAFSLAPRFQFEWRSESVLDVVRPTFSAAGAQELPAPENGEQISDERVAANAADVESFTGIGLQVDAMPTEPVFVRTRAESGEWTSWNELHFSTDEGPDPGSPERESAERSRGSAAVNSEPLLTAASNGFEINGPSEVADDAEVVVVREVERRSVATATPLADAAVPAPFGVHWRGQWGARATAPASYGSTIRMAVVHHSVTSNTYSPADVPGMIRSIQAYHIDGNGWSDIGYNFVVDKYGGIWEGRGGGIDQPVIGAHAGGFNTNTVGVMLLGDYTQASPTAAALESIAKIIGWKMMMSNVDPAGRVDFTSGGSTSIPAGETRNFPRVVGHRDVGATSCPGSIQGSLDWIRARSQEWTNWIRATSVPFGQLDAVSGGVGSVSVAGWAIDQDATAATQVRVDVAGRSVTVDASANRPDVGAAYPQFGPAHGFSAGVWDVPPGYQWVCVTLLNQNYGTGDVGLGCQLAWVGDPYGTSPSGHIIAAGGGPGSFGVSGAVRDPNAPDTPLTVDVEVNGRYLTSVNTTGGPGLFAVSPVGLLGGNAQVCLIARNLGAGSNTRFACSGVAIGSAPPTGHWDYFATNSGGVIGVAGRVFDPETVDWTQVVVTVDGRRYVLRGDEPRPAYAGSFPAGYGVNHGWSATLGAGKGNHTVCVDAVDFPSGAFSSLGCRNFVIK